MKTTSPLVWVIILVGAILSPGHGQTVSGKGKDQYLKAVDAMGVGELDKALSLFKKAFSVSEGSNDPVVISGKIAEIETIQGNYEGAKANLAQAAQKTGNPGYKLELARLIMKTDWTGAREALDLTKEVALKDMKNVDAWLLYGKALSRTGLNLDAIRAYERVTMVINPKELRGYYGLAEAYLLHGMGLKARNALSSALAINPEAAETYAWMGRAYDRDTSKASNYSAAIKEYQWAYQIDKKPMYLAHLLFNVIMSESYDVAKTYRKTLDKAPQDSVKLWLDGLYKELEGDVGGALALHQKAVTMNWENVYAHFSLAHLCAGMPTPGFGPIRGTRVEGWRYTPHRDLQRAAQEISTVRSLDPTFPYTTSLSAKINEAISLENPANEPPTPEAAARIKKMVSYYQHLMRTR